MFLFIGSFASARWKCLKEPIGGKLHVYLKSTILLKFHLKGLNVI